MNKNIDTHLSFAHELDFSDILTNPILDIAARFWEEDRYQAFQVCYRSMRRIDDLVDDRKATGETISPDEAALYTRMIDDWIGSIREERVDDPFQKEFLAIRSQFDIPLWPWERLCRAMIYDLQHNGYSSFLSFLRYTEGAAIAPAAIFMHLCGVTRSSESYARPAFDIRRAARPLALFSYLVHIIRDFQKDARSHLNYFAFDLLKEYSLDIPDLVRIAKGEPIPDSFRQLVGRYKSIAEYYRRLARNAIDKVAPNMPHRYHLSLEVIYNLYLQIFERIDPEKGTFTSEELNPPPEEVKARLELTIEKFTPSKK